MTDKHQLAVLEALTPEQRKLVALVYLKGEDSLKQAVAKVMGVQDV